MKQWRRLEIQYDGSRIGASPPEVKRRETRRVAVTARRIRLNWVMLLPRLPYQSIRFFTAQALLINRWVNSLAWNHATSVVQTRIDQAILPVWPNGATLPIDTVFAVNIPVGTQVHIGEIWAQGGFYVGGIQQIVVPKPWSINGVQTINSSPLK